MVKVVNEPEVFETLHDVGRSFGYRLRPLSMTAGAPLLGPCPRCALWATASIHRGIDGSELASMKLCAPVNVHLAPRWLRPDMQ